jgi:hypothetical protein
VDTGEAPEPAGVFVIRLERELPGFTQFLNNFYALEGISGPSDVATYCALCSFASEPKETDRHVSPSLAGLCSRAHLGETALRLAIRRLQTAGAISVEAIPGRRSNVVIRSLFRLESTPTESEGVEDQTPSDSERDLLGICGSPLGIRGRIRPMKKDTAQSSTAFGLRTRENSGRHERTDRSRSSWLRD